MDKTRDRLTSVTAAVLLQMGFVAIFIYSLPLMAPPKRLAREITFFLPRLREPPTPNPAPPRIRPSALPGIQSPAPPSRALPPITSPSITLAPPTTDLQTFGKDLFGCTPENLSKLTPEQRTHCSGFAVPPGTAMTEPPSLVKDMSRRHAELAAKNTPARVPCVTLRTRALGFTGQDTGFVTDPLCLLDGWINGFGGLPP